MSLELLCLSLFLTISTSSKVANNNATCGIPGQPFGGAVLSTSQKYFQDGDIVTYSCEYIDYLLGSANRTCGTDGKWTGSVPLCLSPAIKIYNGFTNVKNEERSITLDGNLTTCTSLNSPDALRYGLGRGSTLIVVRVVLNSAYVAIDFKFSVHTAHYPGESTACVEIGSGNFGPESNWNYLYMGLGGWAILIVLIVAIVLIVRGVKRCRAFEDPYYAWSGQDNTVTSSHIHVPFPLPRDAHLIQETTLRHLDGGRSSESLNHYSVAIIPGEENQYMTIVENPKEDTSTPLYDDCFSGCSRGLYDDCGDSRQQIPPVPQPPQTRFSQLVILKPNLVLSKTLNKP